MEQDVEYDSTLKYLSKLFKEKASRSDVVTRAKLNKDSEFTVIKTTYNSFCTPAAKALQESLEKCLFDINKAIFEAYLLANLHVIRCVDQSRPVPKIDQTFYYRCLSAVSQSTQRKSEIKDIDFRNTVELYLATRPTDYEPADSKYIASGLFQQTSQQMATMAKNSTSMEFWRRFKRYLKSRYDLTGKESFEKTRDIRSREYDGDDAIVKSYRTRLPKTDGAVEDHPELVMPLQVMFLRHFEQRVQEERNKRQSVGFKSLSGTGSFDKKHRLFSLLPTKAGFGCNQIKICPNGFYGLLKRSNVQGLPKSDSDFRQQANIYWRRYFNIEKFETEQRKFGNEIVTDGKSVSILLRKPKREQISESDADLSRFRQIWGLDPGRREIFVASDMDGDRARWSTKRYYQEAGFTASAKKVKSWQIKNSFVQRAMTEMPTSKTADETTLMNYFKFALSRLDQLLGFGMARRMRDLKFSRYVGKQKALNNMCEDLTSKAGRKTLIGFGDWSNKDSAGIIKKSPAGPVKALERELKKRCRVISIDEYRSSKLHECCHEPMTNMYSEKQFVDRTGSKTVKTSKIHSVLLCRTRGCNGIRVNRDVNASRNMLMLLREQLCGRRPVAFSRSVDSCHQ